MKQSNFLVLIPTYNEAKIIEKVIEDIKNELSGVDILVVDANSTDNTAEIVKKNNIKVIFIDKQFGISLAVEAGLLFAWEKKYDYLIRIDGDGQHSSSDVKKNLEYSIENKIDLMIGSRFLGNSDYKTNNIRMTGINLLRSLLNKLYNVDITDCTSGCQIFSKRLIAKLANDKKFEYSEIGAICKTSELGFLIEEKSINMKPRKTGISSFNFINSFNYMFKNLLTLILSINFGYKKKL
jgi:glycosyltransferase involved in cell wall biosynthesis